MKYCQKCGKQLVDEAIVCTGCGCSVAPFWKRGFSLPKRSSQIDLHKAKKTRRLLYLAEMVAIILVLLSVLCVNGFWDVDREKVWYCKYHGQGKSCSVCESSQQSFFNKSHSVAVTMGSFFDLFQGFDDPTIEIFGGVFFAFLVVEFIFCLLSVLNVRLRLWTAGIPISALLSFIIIFVLVNDNTYEILADGLWYGDVLQYRGFIKWSFAPTGMCYFVIFLLLLAVALDISAKVLHRKAKRQVEDAEENKTL